MVICQGCKPKLPKHKNIIYTKKASYNKKTFLDIYSGNVKKEKITLYKSVNPETEKDFWSGTIHYKDGTTVIAPDWDNNKGRECGGGLHLSPMPGLTQLFNKGKIKVCEVNKKDFVVYPFNIKKVRCRKVKVIGDYK